METCRNTHNNNTKLQQRCVWRRIGGGNDLLHTYDSERYPNNLYTEDSEVGDNCDHHERVRPWRCACVCGMCGRSTIDPSPLSDLALTATLLGPLDIITIIILRHIIATRGFIWLPTLLVKVRGHKPYHICTTYIHHRGTFLSVPSKGLPYIYMCLVHVF